MPLPTQLASIAAWNDDAARASRIAACIARSSRRCCRSCARCMEVDAPEASFYLWPQVGDDERFTRRAVRAHSTSPCCRAATSRAIRRTAIPGRGRVRISLVATVPECVDAAAAHSRVLLAAIRGMRVMLHRPLLIRVRRMTARPRRHHRRRLRAPHRIQPEERTRRSARCRRAGDRAARHRQGARRRETRRPVARQSMAEEGRAAVVPAQRQPADRRRLHAVLRQGRRSSTPTTMKRASAPKACASCRTRSCGAARTSRRTPCSCPPTSTSAPTSAKARWSTPGRPSARARRSARNVHLSGGAGSAACSSRCRPARPSSKTTASSARAPRSSRA